MTDKHSDQRHFTRVAIDCKAELICTHRLWQTRLLDVSLKGALLYRPEDFIDSGEACTLELQLEPSNFIISMHGHIVHSEADHLGFHCQHIDMESIGHLKRLLELNMGDEALLERELAEMLAGG
ncbi:MAG: PilZ domain-containing protein [Thiohalomonadaceae bacterium]